MSVFGIEIYESTERPPESEKESHRPDLKSVKADNDDVDVDQWDKWSVDSFDNLDKYPVKNVRAIVVEVYIKGEYDE